MKCGSQVVLCDLPIRFDTYSGCEHGCAYCFARNKKFPLADVKADEGLIALGRFLAGKRTRETCWCDWPIPLHWGGVSDPFQPCEREQKRSLQCLERLVETGYPFVVSTKGRLAAEEPYLSLLASANCVVQISAVADVYDKLELGAPPFAERVKMIAALVKAGVQRVVVRLQPYVVTVLKRVCDTTLPLIADAGAHGVTIEGMKRRTAYKGMITLGTNEYVYPVEVLRSHFMTILSKCRGLGLRFYAAENRLRKMGDDLCCCGVDGLDGFQVNRANLNRWQGVGSLDYTDRMRTKGTAYPFKALVQTTRLTQIAEKLPYAEAMDAAARAQCFREALGFAGGGMRG